MSEEPLHHAHDKLFKFAFKDRNTAVAAFEAYLPEAITRHLDFTETTLVPGTYVDEHFQGSESDLLYRVRYRGTVDGRR